MAKESNKNYTGCSSKLHGASRFSKRCILISFLIHSKIHSVSGTLAFPSHIRLANGNRISSQILRYRSGLPFLFRESHHTRNVAVPSHIRLANGNRTCEGRVEVYHNGSWGTICDDLWNMLNAQVVCRQLSCGEAISADTDAKYGEGSGLILMDDVKCQGNETAVEACPHNGWGVSNCRHKEDAGVNCSDIRLANGNRTCEGRVEVYHNGSWGTICDDLWNMLNAQVVCRQLSCGEAISADTDAKYGEGSGLILMDDVKCQGNETAVEACPHNGWGVSNCRHKEDAGVNCSGTPCYLGNTLNYTKYRTD
ncbi:scavenger receptor cysteine-rich domain-containing protein DMBT1-like [Paroedura picta]|uniref:scavenger receptor cysteine-rich domain-containing protein DMBT1-like n=1 Tax=Paroedura picta TaxID=143630 RepID=UPI00405628F6